MENQKIPTNLFNLPLNDNKGIAPEIHFLGKKIGEYIYPNAEEPNNEVSVKSYTLYEISIAGKPGYIVYHKLEPNTYKFLVYKSWNDLITLNNLENKFFNQYKFDLNHVLLSKILKKSNKIMQVNLIDIIPND